MGPHCPRMSFLNKSGGDIVSYDFSDRVGKYVGDLSQLAGVKRFTFAEGKAKGVEAFEVRTGGGLNYTVLADRCLDIAWAEYRGVPFGYIANAGVVAPAYFDPSGANYLNSFTAGLLSTCGLTYLGAPCRDGDEELGLHGRIGNTPAGEIGAAVEWPAKDPRVVIAGKVRESRLFGADLILSRNIESPLGQNKIRITDRVRNAGFEPQPLMFLYHVNLGYPLLQENSELIAPVKSVVPRDAAAQPGLSAHLRMEPPRKGYAEQVFYLDLAADADGMTSVALVNMELGFGVYERFNLRQLPRFIQWKQMGEGFYVLGLEPGNCYVEGRAKERQRGTLQSIEPGETREFSLEIGVLEGKEEIEAFRAKTAVLAGK